MSNRSQVGGCIGCIIGVFICIVSNFYDGFVWLGIGGFFIGAIVGLCLEDHSANKKPTPSIQAKSNDETVRKDETEDFYLYCKKANVDSVSDKANIARVVLLAQQYGINKDEKEIISMFKEGKRKTKEKEKAAKLQKLKAEEAALYEQNARYIHCKGLEKKRAIILERMAPYLEVVDGCNSSISSNNKAGIALTQKEKDWALLGGIASGIAGGAAGLAVAMDAQTTNQSIREQNSNITSLVSQVNVSLLNQRDEAKKEVEYWKGKLAESQVKLVEYLPENELLSMLAPKVLSIKKTKTGSVKIKVAIDDPHGIKIYDSADAVIDGSVKVILKSDNKVVGETYFPLGFFGTRHDVFFGGTAETICIDVKDDVEDYDISFEPQNLCAREEF